MLSKQNQLCAKGLIPEFDKFSLNEAEKRNLLYMDSTERLLYLHTLRVLDLQQKINEVGSYFQQVKPLLEGITTVKELNLYLTFHIKNCLENAREIDPNFSLPNELSYAAYRIKLIVPETKFPNYNFFSVILGTKGKTQKNIEELTGASVFLKGFSIHSELNKKYNWSERETEPLYVEISATNKESFEKAQRVVEVLLNPVSQNG